MMDDQRRLIAFQTQQIALLEHENKKKSESIRIQDVGPKVVKVLCPGLPDGKFVISHKPDFSLDSNTDAGFNELRTIAIVVEIKANAALKSNEGDKLTIADLRVYHMDKKTIKPDFITLRDEALVQMFRHLVDGAVLRFLNDWTIRDEDNCKSFSLFHIYN